jgi:F-type H+-transporting ATPase subunit epsilon
MADTFELEIVTPDKLLVRERVEQVQIPGKTGELGVLPGHAPLITTLTIGEISYREGTNTHYLSVAWGFAEVLPNKVTILADTAERAEEIDLKRAQEAKARAEEALKRSAADLDFDATLYALHRADVRISVAARAVHAATAH